VATVTESGVELDGVSVDFGDVSALNDVSITVDQGEFFTLVGPSGCGKTTTLRTIAGFESPTEGTVTIDGEDVTDRPPEDRNVGVVFQNYALFPHMNVRENVGYGLRHRDPPGGVSRRERVDELLELVDMTGLAERDPTELSGGQQQRIALARALAPGPELLLLDEPLSALDVRLRERLRVTLREIQQSLDITTVYVTHDQEEALAISDRVAVVADGGIQQVGSPEAIYRSPASRFVAEFVGDNNVFDRTVQGSDPPHVSIDDQAVPLEAAPTLSQGDRATLSIRPEDLSFHERDVSITVTVQQVEFLGDAYRVHCEWGETEILVKTTDDDIPRETVTLWFDVTDVYVVDRSATE
jgi:thiamine transport system ATP-binding protein